MHIYTDLASRMSSKQTQIASSACIPALLLLALNSNRQHAGTKHTVWEETHPVWSCTAGVVLFRGV